MMTQEPHRVGCDRVHRITTSLHQIVLITFSPGRMSNSQQSTYKRHPHEVNSGSPLTACVYQLLYPIIKPQRYMYDTYWRVVNHGRIITTTTITMHNDPGIDPLSLCIHPLSGHTPLIRC
jgi:hypothetical protein